MGCLQVLLDGWQNQFCIYTLISLPWGDIEELVVPETRGPPITGAYKQNIYIFQAWSRELLLKDEWDDDVQIFDLDWNQYDNCCHESCHVSSPLHHKQGEKSWPRLLERRELLLPNMKEKGRRQVSIQLKWHGSHDDIIKICMIERINSKYYHLLE